jgi:hypothetical protein
MELQDDASSMALEGNRKTEVSTDMATGFLLAMKLESQSQGVSTIPQLGGRSIPTSMTSTITYKRI